VLQAQSVWTGSARLGLGTDLAGDGVLQEVLDLLDRDPVDHRAEEAFDDQLLRLGPGNAAGLEVEQVLRLDLADRRLALSRASSVAK